MTKLQHVFATVLTGGAQGSEHHTHLRKSVDSLDLDTKSNSWVMQKEMYCLVELHTLVFCL